MRRDKAIKNVKYSLIFTILYLIFNFISRFAVIKGLGIDIGGFNTLIQNIMGFLSIAELGIAMAITYALYEPLNKKEYNKINEIMVLFGGYYKRVAYIIFGVGIVVSFGLPFFIKGQIPIKDAYIYYFMFLINGALSYIFIYKQTLIIADQKQYLIVTITNLFKILKIVIQVASIYLLKSYFVWIILEVVFNLTGLIIIHLKASKIYPLVQFKSEKSFKVLKVENRKLIKSIGDVFCHKIAAFIVFQTDGILISLFLNLRDTAIYGNYMMVIGGLTNLFNSIVGSLTASIGDLISEKDNKKSYEIFKQLYIFDSVAALVITYILYKVINVFMELWIGKSYIFAANIVLVLMINIYIQISRGTVEKFKDSYGLFWDRWAPVAEAVINLVISYLLLVRIGIIGLFIGTLISNILIILIWKPFMLYRYGFKIKIYEHIKLFVTVIIMGICCIVISNEVLKIIKVEDLVKNISIIKFILYGAIVTSVICASSLIFLIKKEFRIFIWNLIGKKYYEKIRRRRL